MACSRRHGFVRIHRRYLINRAAESRRVGDKFVRMQSGQELPIGTALREQPATAN